MKEVEMNLSNFKVPKVRLGNRTYSQSELQDYRKANTQRYNQEVRHNRHNREYTAFYNSTQWRKLRQQVLMRDNYLCQHCLSKGIVNDKNLIVHHKIELKRDWSKRLDMDNLEVVCFSCHNKIHSS
ncbi:HNH endonuclease [Staphylococcus phage StB20]|uniref:HNH endonuclease n=1 Tax=Staphylococcus phage StB20 TaxID=1147043 RepID=UPI0002534CE2|nr:HNH endonuclease [Staphylococcus phage StB20]AFD22319.1 HNH endonuclease [Staphylococcus phage StB20]